MIIYADGGGDGTICVITDKPRIAKIDVNTHNEAEYGSLIWAIGLIGDYEEHIIRMDSQLVIYQMTGYYKVRSPTMKALHDIAKENIKQKGINVTFEWVPREENLAGMHLEEWKKRSRGAS